MYKIAILGPESSGKTTLALALSKTLNGCFVPEYSREYLTNKLTTSHYQLTDIIEIAKEQFENNLGSQCNSDYLICDTEMTVIKIWIEDKVGNLPKIIHELYDNQCFNIYFLCSPDFPWQFDPLREDSGRRDYLFDQYRIELERKKRNFHVLSGDVDTRIKNVLDILVKNDMIDTCF